MTEGKLYSKWPEADDRTVVSEMIRDPDSKHWHECCEFVKMRVQLQATNIALDQRDDIAQDVMIRIHHALPAFQHRCALKTWIFDIIYNCVIDAYRKSTHVEQRILFLADLTDEIGHEGSAFPVNMLDTVEGKSIIHEELTKALEVLEEYLSKHASPERNRRILEMVIFEGHSREEAAKEVGCSGAVASYIVRSAQSYVRKKLEYGM